MRIFFLNDEIRKWFSIITTVLIAGLLAIWGIYGIGRYGIALFIVTPIFIGLFPTLLYGYKKALTKKECRKIAFTTLGIFTLGLLVFAIEGIICIAMVAPFGILLTWVGSLIAFSIQNRHQNKTPTTMAGILLIVSSIMLTENYIPDNQTLIPVTTSIEINATHPRASLVCWAFARLTCAF